MFGETIEYKQEEDSGIIDENEFVGSFQDAMRTGMSFAGLQLGTNISGDDKMSKIAKRVSRLSRSDQEIFANKALRAVDMIKKKDCFKIEFSDASNITERCYRRIPEFKYKSALALLLAGKYASADEGVRTRIIECLPELKVTLVDIIKYIRLLRHYNVI